MEEKDHGKAYQVVMDLVDDVPDIEGHRVVFDNWYSSVKLAKVLAAREVNIIGTIRPNRAEYPGHLMNKKLKNKGDMDYRMTQLDSGGAILALKIKDTKIVHLISTMHS